MQEAEILSQQLRQQLDLVEPSANRDERYYPCLVELRNGETIPCAYLLEVTPANQLTVEHITCCLTSLSIIQLSDVVAIGESPMRLPARFANELYERGESGMGYCLFTIIYMNGQKQTCVTGNWVDFIRYPKGRSSADIYRVLPHEGNRMYFSNGPDYSWCLFSR